MRYKAPDIRCPQYRASWIATWLAEGTRGRKILQWALDDLRAYEAERETAAAMRDIRRALSGGE